MAEKRDFAHEEIPNGVEPPKMNQPKEVQESWSSVDSFSDFEKPMKIVKVSGLLLKMRTLSIWILLLHSHQTRNWMIC